MSQYIIDDIIDIDYDSRWITTMSKVDVNTIRDEEVDTKWLDCIEDEVEK